MKVTRKDGRTEDFIPEKIVVAIVKAGGRLDNARAVAKEVESALASNKTVTTKQVREEVLKRLAQRDPAARKGWMDYEASKK